MSLALILSLLQAAAALIPEIAQVVPIVQSMINGQTVSNAQLAQLTSVIASLEAQAAAVETKVIGS